MQRRLYVSYKKPKQYFINLQAVYSRLFLVYPLFTPPLLSSLSLPPSCLFGCCCCSLLAHSGLSYRSILATQWEREECRTIREGRRDGGRILMTPTAAKLWQLQQIHHSAFLATDSRTLREKTDTKRGNGKRGHVAQWAETLMVHRSVSMEPVISSGF